MKGSLLDGLLREVMMGEGLAAVLLVLFSKYACIGGRRTYLEKVYTPTSAYHYL